MKNSLLLLTLLLNLNLYSQEVPLWKLPDLKRAFVAKDSVVVINFWATWCKPCVKELPNFEAAKQKYKNQPVKFLLVSLDFKRELESRVKPFLLQNKVNSEVVLFDEPDYNSWIDKVDPSWTGGIPATMILDNRKGTRKFYEKEFETGELEKVLNKMLAPE